MATPSRTRNFFGAIVDRMLPGTNYNPQTGQYSNIGKGLLGAGAAGAAGLFGGPAASFAVRQGANRLIDNGSLFGGGQPGGVVPEAIGGMPGMQIGNLGFGAPQPMQAPSLPAPGFQNAGFGNHTIGSALPVSQPWQAQSQWGTQQNQPQSNSPFSANSPAAQAAAAQMRLAPTQQGISAAGTGSMFLGQMDRMNMLARNAMNDKRIIR